jgi:hypothetical protein
VSGIRFECVKERRGVGVRGGPGERMSAEIGFRDRVLVSWCQHISLLIACCDCEIANGSSIAVDRSCGS